LLAAKEQFIKGVEPNLTQTAEVLTEAANTKVALPIVVGETSQSGAINIAYRQLRFSPSSSFQAYIGTACVVAGTIVALFFHRGWSVVCRIIIYLMALSTMKLTVKLLYVDHQFNFPKFVTATHFYASGVVSLIVLSFRKQPLNSLDTTAESRFAHILSEDTKLSQKLAKRYGVPTSREFWLMIMPIASCFAVSIASNNFALVFSSAAFTEIVGATSPVATIAVVVLLGMPFNWRILVPTLITVTGCVVSTSGELHFSGFGMACCLISVFSRSFKTAMQERMMGGATKEKFDPVTLLCWMCIPSAVLMSAWSLSVEGLTPFITLRDSSRRPALGCAMLLCCANACILNLSNLFCTKDLGAVGTQLVGQMKSVLTVLGAVALFHEAVTPIEIAGFIGVLIGVFLFSYADQPSAKPIR